MLYLIIATLMILLVLSVKVNSEKAPEKAPDKDARTVSALASKVSENLLLKMCEKDPEERIEILVLLTLAYDEQELDIDLESLNGERLSEITLLRTCKVRIPSRNINELVNMNYIKAIMDPNMSVKGIAL